MLITIDELKELYPGTFDSYTDKQLTHKLNVIETAIRKYTNNSFQDRFNRGAFMSTGGKLVGDDVMYLSADDTVQITCSRCNDGLYVVKDVQGGTITLESNLIDAEYNLVSKVEYPADVIDGAVQLLEYDLTQKGKKTGIASETISRHSVSYVQYSADNTINGYPAELFGFCSRYVRGRT